MAARIAITIPSTESDRALRDALDVLVYANSLWLRRNPHVAPLYSSGVRFRPERQEGSGVELYQTIPEVIAQGWGDCDDLAGWRCAELRAQGIDARADLRTLGRGAYHAVVIVNGAVEDPAHVIKAKELEQWRRY